MGALGSGVSWGDAAPTLQPGIRDVLNASPEVLGVFYVLLTVPMVVVVHQALGHRDEPGGLPLAVALGATTCWSLVYGVGLVVPDVRTTIAANVLRNSFTAVATIAWFYVIVEYTRADWFERGSILAALSVNPVALIVLGATNEHHHLVWAEGTTITAGGVLEPEFGTYFFIHAAVTCGLLLASAILLVRKFRSTSGVFRKQSAALLVGMAISWLGSILFVTGTVPVEHLDTGPIGVALGGTVFLLALFHYDFLEVAPVARETLMENMGDGRRARHEGADHRHQRAGAGGTTTTVTIPR